MERIRVAVLGAGYWGKNICRNFENCELTELAIICDKQLDRADTMRNNFSPNASTCSSIDDVLQSTNIDAVSIVTPVHTHFELANQALHAGKHVLIEKPMAMTSTDALRLVETSTKRGLQVMCDHTFCYSGPVRKIRELIQGGTLGQLLQINSTRLNLGLLQRDVNVLWDLSPHDISIINYITAGDEQPDSVIAHGSSVTGYNYEVDATMSISFKSGLKATIHNSWLYPTKERKMIIVGTKKMLVWDDLADNKLLLFDRGVNIINHKTFEYYDSEPEIIDYEKTEPLSLMVREFAEAIMENRTPLSSAHEGFMTIQLLEAANKAMTTNKRIQV